MGIEARYSVILDPIRVPDLLVQQGDKGPRAGTVPLASIPQDALDQLTAQWLTDVYRKADKPNPWTRHP